MKSEDLKGAWAKGAQASLIGWEKSRMSILLGAEGVGRLNEELGGTAEWDAVTESYSAEMILGTSRTLLGQDLGTFFGICQPR